MIALTFERPNVVEVVVEVAQLVGWVEIAVAGFLVVALVMMVMMMRSYRDYQHHYRHS